MVALEPATGQATLMLSAARDSASHIQLLETIWLIIEDNLSTHSSRQVKLALAAWPEVQVQFIPKYACWLNLIEPWWRRWPSKDGALIALRNWPRLCLAVWPTGMRIAIPIVGRNCRNSK